MRLIAFLALSVLPLTVLGDTAADVRARLLERYPSTLKFIDPTIGQVSHKVRIWTELDNSEGQLREGLEASIEMVPGIRTPVTQPE